MASGRVPNTNITVFILSCYRCYLFSLSDGAIGDGSFWLRFFYLYPISQSALGLVAACAAINKIVL